MKKNNNKGFTLMEMLIVVAIIAVLVAIAIPVFTNQLEKSREATDAANIRSAYAEVMACALTDTDRAVANGTEVTNGVKKTVSDGKAVWSKDVGVCQKHKGCHNSSITEIAGIKLNDATNPIAAQSLNGWTVTYSEETGKCTITENK